MARHQGMRAPIHSVKHFVPTVITNVAAAATVNLVAVDAVVASAVNLVTEVIEGAEVRAVWVEIWGTGIGATNTSQTFILSVEKLVAGATPMTHAQSLNMHVYPNKKNILYTTQGVSNARIDGNQSLPVIRQWISIPRGKCRFGLGDQLVINVSAVVQIFQICGMFIYKEYQ